MSRNVTRVVMVVIALAAVAGGVLLRQHHSPPEPAVAATPGPSQLFYGQRLRDGTNNERDMAEYRGRVTVVNFWATWCAPCVEEIPSFSKIHEEFGDRVGFVGLGIDSPGNVIGFNERFKPSYPLVAAGAGGTELARAFGNAQGALPYTVLLGKDGQVLESHLGKVDEATLRRWLAPYAGPANKTAARVTGGAAPQS